MAEAAPVMSEAAQVLPVAADPDSEAADDTAPRSYRLIPSVMAGSDTLEFGVGYHSIEGGSLTVPGRKSMDDSYLSSYEVCPGLGVVTGFREKSGVRIAYGVFTNAKDAHGNFILRQATPDEAIGIAAQNQIAGDAQAHQVIVAGILFYVTAIVGGVISLVESRILAGSGRRRPPPDDVPFEDEVEPSPSLRKAPDTLATTETTHGTAIVPFDGAAATLRLLGTTTTPGGRQIMFHAADRMVNPPRGRVAMTPEQIDEVLDGATRIVKRSFSPAGNTLTIENYNLPGKPRVIVDEATCSRVITVINPREKR
jgi:hypothetical protein